MEKPFITMQFLREQKYATPNLKSDTNRGALKASQGVLVEKAPCPDEKLLWRISISALAAIL